MTWNAHGLSGLPLHFVPNRGQADARARFVVDLPEGRIELRDRGLALRLRSRDAGGARGGTVRFQYVGASARVRPEASQPAPGKVHYLLGRDPSGWLKNLPTTTEVAYRSLYPGIDALYAGRGGALEATYAIAPGAQLARLRLRCPDARQMALDADGSLVLETAAGEIRQSRPVAFQLDGGRRIAVAARFQLDRRGRSYGFELEGPYDPARTLWIDPVLGVLSYLGGNLEDSATALAVDASGQIYLAGFTLSTNFPTQGALRGTPGGNGDAFVTKISASGTTLLYSTYLGGNDRDVAGAIAVDSAGQAYVTGSTRSSDFPFASGFKNILSGSSDAFVTKLTTDGGMAYSTYLGGTGQDLGAAIAIDGAGAAYVAGTTASADFPLSGALQGNLRGIEDAFITKLSATGQALVYSTYLGGSDLDEANGIAVDLSGQAHVVGLTESVNFPVAGAYQSALAGNRDAFVVKLAATGAALLYSTYLGGSEDDAGNAIVLDSGGTASLTGYTRSTDFPVVTPYQSTNRGGADGFLTRLSSSGSVVSFSTYLGGAGSDEGTAVARDSDGAIYVEGTTSSGDFPMALPLRSVLSGDTDVFVTQFASGFQSPAFSTYLGGSGAELAFGVAVDTARRVYVAGQPRSQALAVVSGRQAASGGGVGDAFYARIDPIEPTFVTSLYFPRLVTTDGSGGSTDTSEYTGVAVVNPSSATATLKLSAFDTGGALVAGAGITNPAQVTLAGNGQLAMVDTQIFGSALAARKPTAWMRLDSTVSGTAGFFLVFNGSLSVLDGATVGSRTLTSFVLPEVEDLGFTQVHIPNPANAAAAVTLELARADGSVAATSTRTIAAGGTLVESLATLVSSVPTAMGDLYIRGTSTRGVVPFEYLGRTARYAEGLNGQDPAAGARIVYSPQYVVGGPWRTSVSIVNFENTATTLLMRFIDDSGAVLATRTTDLAPRCKLQIAAQSYFVTPNPAQLTQGYLQITSDRANIGGSVVFGDPARDTFSSALPLVSTTAASALFGQVASDATYFTGIAVLNPSDADASVTVDVFDRNGTRIATRTFTIAARRRVSQLLTQHFPTLPSLSAGYFRVTSTPGVLSFALFGTSSLSVLAAIPPQ
jgi:hypothetical protein